MLDLKKYIDSYKDFPKEGILFRDISPLISDPEAFEETVRLMAVSIDKAKATVIIAPEARGFLLGPTIANRLGIKFVQARKPGKLPGKLLEAKYQLEYGENELYIQGNAISKSDRVILLDDLLATGGTMIALKKLIEEVGAQVVQANFLIELEGLDGRQLLNDTSVESLIKMTAH